MKISTPTLQAQQEPLKAALVELVRIPSVCDEGAGGYPFGEAIDQALRKALQIAGDLGFKTHYGDGGYYGYRRDRRGEEMLGILGHLDVVPPGKLADWDRDPFDPVEKDGMLYGRGTQDDKGPLLAALFAVKALMDAGVKFNKRVRFIFGTDEETLWRCINRYKEKEELPDMGFSPDSRFPLTYAEKGLLQLHLEGSNESGLRLSGGSAFNAVPDMMFYEGERQDDLANKLDELGFAYERNDRWDRSQGQSRSCDDPRGRHQCHRPSVHRPAGDRHRVQSDPISSPRRSAKIRMPRASSASAPTRPPASSSSTWARSSSARWNGSPSIPASRSPYPRKRLSTKLSAAAARYGLEYKEFDWLAPIYLPLDHFMIKTLMKVYRQHSGDAVSEPRASGGATYARAMDNCVAFGALALMSS